LLTLATRKSGFPGLSVELAGLEPATSWVRSILAMKPEIPDLQRIHSERLERRNTARNILPTVLQFDNARPS
jgi:hypothetical protein